MRACVLALGLCVVPLAAKAERLQLDRYFQGDLTAEGAVDNTREGVKRPFKVTMKAAWTPGGVGTLDQDIAFADGERQHRVWTFEPVSPGRWVGKRADFIGDADVYQDGEGVRMVYSAHTRNTDGRTYDLGFNDLLTQEDARTVRSSGTVKLLFFTVGKVDLTIHKSSK